MKPDIRKNQQILFHRINLLILSYPVRKFGNLIYILIRKVVTEICQNRHNVKLYSYKTLNKKNIT